MNKVIEYFNNKRIGKVLLQLCGAFLITALGYNSMQPQDLSTWSGVFDLILGVLKNPYLLCLCLYNGYLSLSNTSKKEV